MARTVDDVISAVRELLQDEQTPYRYSDSRLRAAYNGAMEAVLRIRPDLWVNSDYEPVYFSAGATFPLDARFFMAVVYYVTQITEAEKDGPEFDKRSEGALLRFKQALVAI
jgi:hypothetical protein